MRNKTLECSSAGDQRFSAFYARVHIPFNKVHKHAKNTKSIEEWYQLAKRFGQKKPFQVSDAKGKVPTHLVINGKRYPAHYLTQWYKLLWLKYLDDNPDLVKFASQFDKFTDKFRGRRTSNCQADVIQQYVQKGRQSIIDECEYLLDLMEGWDIFMAKKPVHDLPVVMAWTDGACKGNGRPNARGGWAYIVQHEDTERVKSIGIKYRGITNNQMELRAVIEIFKRLKCPCYIHLHTDSEYVERAFSEGRLKRWMKNGWKTTGKDTVANKEMWMELVEAIRTGKHVLKVTYRDEEEDANIKRCHDMAQAAAGSVA